MMNVKVTAKTVTIEIDKASHVFVRAAILGVRLQDVHGPVAPTGKVSIALMGGAAIEAVLLMYEAQRLVNLLTLAMEGDDGSHD